VLRAVGVVVQEHVDRADEGAVGRDREPVEANARLELAQFARELLEFGVPVLVVEQRVEVMHLERQEQEPGRAILQAVEP
jgi:hypothetical protein